MILAYTFIYKDYSFGAIALCTKFRPSFSRIPLSFRGGLTYVVAYDFLSQLWDYDNPDLERLHAFAKSLLPRLYGKAEGGDPLEGAARLAGYKLKDATDHKLSLEGGEAKPLKPMGRALVHRGKTQETGCLSSFKKRTKCFQAT